MLYGYIHDTLISPWIASALRATHSTPRNDGRFGRGVWHTPGRIPFAPTFPSLRGVECVARKAEAIQCAPMLLPITVFRLRLNTVIVFVLYPSTKPKHGASKGQLVPLRFCVVNFPLDGGIPNVLSFAATERCALRVARCALRVARCALRYVSTREACI